MITHGEDVEIHALHKQGWSISAIARHLGLDRKTVRVHLAGERQAGVRRGSGVDGFDAVADYVRQRLVEDPHVRATVLFAEAQKLGYPASYPTFVRRIRLRGLRPECQACSPGRAHTDIEHPPGEEIQWDWLELRETPWGEAAFVLVGVLSHSGRLRCWFSESMDQAHLVAGIHQVLVRLGGSARRWRTDRMAAVVAPGTDRLQASFAAVAKHYGAAVDVCPAAAAPPQGRSREGHRLSHPVVVAHRSGRLARSRPGLSGPLVCRGRGCSSAPCRWCGAHRWGGRSLRVVAGAAGHRVRAVYVVSPDLGPPTGLRLAEDEIESMVMDLTRQGPVTNALVRARTGIDRAHTLSILARLVKQGHLVRQGERRGTRYLLP